MIKILALLAASGGGKTYLRQEIMKHFPEDFFIMQQYTTREIRESEREIANTINSYMFITNDEYEKIKPELIARTEINNKKYGSRLNFEEFQKGKIGIVIVDENGVKNIEEQLKELKEESKIFKLGIYVDKEKLISEISTNERAERISNIDEEYKRYSLCDLIINREMIYNCGSNLENKVNFKNLIHFIENTLK